MLALVNCFALNFSFVGILFLFLYLHLTFPSLIFSSFQFLFFLFLSVVCSKCCKLIFNLSQFKGCAHSESGLKTVAVTVACECVHLILPSSPHRIWQNVLFLYWIHFGGIEQKMHWKRCHAPMRLFTCSVILWLTINRTFAFCHIFLQQYATTSIMLNNRSVVKYFNIDAPSQTYICKGKVSTSFANQIRQKFRDSKRARQEAGWKREREWNALRPKILEIKYTVFSVQCTVCTVQYA